MKLSFIESLTEATADQGPRIPHPEDTIFDGAAEAQKYVQALIGVIADPGSISIKWDGGIALVFGRKTEGEFFCADKYMPARGVLPTSPAQWREYDQARGADRNDLYAKIETIWDGLAEDVIAPGTYKGDLMSVGPTPVVNGMYEFRPTTVTYRIPPRSPIGQLIANKVGVIVVHQRDSAPWDGKTGLDNRGNVAVLNPTAGIRFTLNNPVKLVSAAQKAVSGNLATQAESFLKGMDGVAQAAIKKYFNHKITGQTGEELDVWLQHNVSGKQYRLLVGENQGGYIYKNAKGYQALLAVWNAIYALKVNLAQQLEGQVTGFEQWTGGKKAGEGFVVNTPLGLVKLVNRGVFGVAHFNK
jgi:hypothetical protein